MAKSILKIIIQSFLTLTMLLDQCALAGDASLLRALSLAESGRGSAIPAASSETSSAAYWWYLFSLDDDTLHTRMEGVYKRLDKAWFDVLCEEGFVDRFARRYESGSIAVLSGSDLVVPQRFGWPGAYGYDNKFGIMNDIHLEVAEIYRCLGIEGDAQKQEDFLRSVQHQPLSKLRSRKAFARLVNIHTGLALNLIEQDRLVAMCRKIKPWLGFYFELRPFEQDFLNRFARSGEGVFIDPDTWQALSSTFKLAVVPESKRHVAKDNLRAVMIAAREGRLTRGVYEQNTGRNDYTEFLGNAFWLLLFRCGLRQGHFDGESGYRRFIKSLFILKFNRGEITDSYFVSDDGRNVSKGRQVKNERDRLARKVQERLDDDAELGLMRRGEGHRLPIQIIRLYGTWQNNVHHYADRDLRLTHLEDPMAHTFTVLSGLNTVKRNNRKCLFIAAALHDISKPDIGQDLYLSEAVSETMVMPALDDWGFTPHLTQEEIALITALVRNHADIFSVRPGTRTGKPSEVAAALKPPVQLDGWIDLYGYRNLCRNLAAADILSISGEVRARVTPGTLGDRELMKLVRSDLIPTALQRPFADVILGDIINELNSRVEWAYAAADWIGQMSTADRTRFLEDLTFMLADRNLESVEYLERLLLLKHSRLVRPETKDIAATFIRNAYNRVTRYQESLLPSIQVPGQLFRLKVTPFDEALRRYIDSYDIPQDVLGATRMLGARLNKAVAEVLSDSRVLGNFAYHQKLVGSVPRETYRFSINRFGNTHVDADFDFHVFVGPDAVIPSCDMVSRLLLSKLNTREYTPALAAYLLTYRGEQHVDLGYIEVDWKVPDAVCARIFNSKKNNAVLEVTISKAPVSKYYFYNSKAAAQLDKLTDAQQEEFRKNVRALRDFIMNPAYLDIPKTSGSRLATGIVAEQLIMQSGGTFASAMRFVYEGSFRSDGSLRDFKEAKERLKLRDICNPMDGENMLHDLKEADWLKLAHASREFHIAHDEGRSFNFEGLAHRPTVVLRTEPLPRASKKLNGYMMSGI